MHRVSRIHTIPFSMFTSIPLLLSPISLLNISRIVLFHFFLSFFLPFLGSSLCFLVLLPCSSYFSLRATLSLRSGSSFSHSSPDRNLDLEACVFQCIVSIAFLPYLPSCPAFALIILSSSYSCSSRPLFLPLLGMPSPHPSHPSSGVYSHL